MLFVRLFCVLAWLLPTLAFVGQPEATPANGRHAIDPRESQVYWTGRAEVGSYSLSGVVPVAQGVLQIEAGRLKSGLVEIDMAGISCNSLGNGASRQKLVDHLKSADFFDARTYPRARFVLTQAVPKEGITYLLSGNLTIKDRTHPIQFPATLEQQRDRLTLKATLTIDRTQYDVRYGSNSFFDKLGNDAIKNEFELDIELVTRP